MCNIIVVCEYLDLESCCMNYLVLVANEILDVGCVAA